MLLQHEPALLTKTKESTLIVLRSGRMTGHSEVILPLLRWGLTRDGFL
jgi:hypothetical protein